MKTYPVLAAIAAATLIAGCSDNSSALVSADSRAQQLIAPVVTDTNEFIGVWISPQSQTINDWVVVFTEGGLVAIDGPGLQADGHYRVEGSLAKLTYRWRNGAASGEHTTFKITSDKAGLVFTTGEPLDPPVRLVRTSGVGDKLRTPSLKATVEPGDNANPFTLAFLQSAP